MGIIMSTPHLILRQLRTDDAYIVNTILNQKSVIKGLPNHPIPLEQTKVWVNWAKDQYELASTNQTHVFHAIMENATNSFVGIIGLNSDERLNNEIVLSCCMLNEYTNRNYATEAIKILAYCGFERLGFEFISAIVLPSNAAAQHVCDKCDFQKIATKEIVIPNHVHMQSFYYYKLCPNHI